MTTILPWAALLITCAAAVWAAVEARRTRKCAESVVPAAAVQPTVAPGGGSGEE